MKQTKETKRVRRSRVPLMPTYELSQWTVIYSNGWSTVPNPYEHKYIPWDHYFVCRKHTCIMFGEAAEAGIKDTLWVDHQRGEIACALRFLLDSSSEFWFFWEF